MVPCSWLLTAFLHSLCFAHRHYEWRLLSLPGWEILTELVLPIPLDPSSIAAFVLWSLHLPLLGKLVLSCALQEVC